MGPNGLGRRFLGMMKCYRKDSSMIKKIALLAFAATSVSLAQMTTFQPNTIAKASEVNANFAYLQNQIATLTARCDSIALLRADNDELKSKVDSLARNDATAGSIIASVIKPASDGYLPNSNQAWILAAGQKGVPGFDSIPDLRGVFLRGIDYAVTGRNITGLDSAREAGSYQADAFLAHSHRIAASSGNSIAQLNDVNASGFAGWANNFVGYTSGVSGKIPGGKLVEEIGGVETRPKNVAVYYYIKVK
jgi:hypothetical protein